MSLLIQALPYGMAIVVLLFLSAFFSGSETALFSLTRTQVRRLRRAGGRGTMLIQGLLQQPRRLLSTILIGNLLVNVLLAALVANLARRNFADNGAVVAIAASSLLLLIFGEVTPKTLAVQHAVLLARLVALPLHWFSMVIAPVRVLLRAATEILLAVCGQQRQVGWNQLTPEEISAMFAVGAAQGVTTDKERELVELIMQFSSLSAHDIMVPRTEISAVKDSLSVGQAYAQACRWKRSRLPIYSEDLDDIWGSLSVVDLPRWRNSELWTRALAEFRDHEQGSPVYPSWLVPETAKLEQLLPQMQQRHASMVVLVDEYGGTAGILTLQDILAAVVGQTVPEAAPLAVEGDKGEVSFLLDGRSHLREVNRSLDKALLQHNGTDTIGGYVTELLQRLPRAGDVVEDQNYRFRVIRMAGRRIGTLRCERLAGNESKHA